MNQLSDNIRPHRKLKKLPKYTRVYILGEGHEVSHCCITKRVSQVMIGITMSKVARESYGSS